MSISVIHPSADRGFVRIPGVVASGETGKLLLYKKESYLIVNEKKIYIYTKRKKKSIHFNKKYSPISEKD